MHQPLPARDILRTLPLPRMRQARVRSGYSTWMGRGCRFANPGGRGPARLFDLRGSGRHADLPIRSCRTDRTYRGHAEPGGNPQLARLRGLGLSLGRPLTCACSAIALGSQTAHPRPRGGRRRPDAIACRACAPTDRGPRRRAGRLRTGRNAACTRPPSRRTTAERRDVARTDQGQGRNLDRSADGADSFDARASARLRPGCRVGRSRADRRRDGIDGARTRCTR